MDNPLHAAWYADKALTASVPLLVNRRIALDTYRFRVECPEMARRVVPGQFFMVRLAGVNDPLIGRALAVYDVLLDEDGRPRYLDFVYLVKGKLTTALARLVKDQEIELWGPLGNGFPTETCDWLVMVAGGIGQTPFLLLGREYLGQQSFGAPPRSAARARRLTLCYGARTAAYLAGVDDFAAAGIEVVPATDDGSLGFAGRVPDLLTQVLDDNRKQRPLIVCCGPEPMMEAVSRIATERECRCLVSLETPMACGIGICFTCVTRVRVGEDRWDYKRTCVDGPVYDGTSICW